MWSDLLFPGSVITIKLFIKLVVAQELRAVEALKAFLAFPLDIAFMALSFGAAILFVTPVTKPGLSSEKIVAFYVVASLCASLIVAASCRFSDGVFNKEQWAKGIMLAAANYAGSLVMLFLAMNVGEFVK